MQNKRVGKEKLLVVSCSAGVGRTSILITMETAMCLIECSQPVYSLDMAPDMKTPNKKVLLEDFRVLCMCISRIVLSQSKDFGILE